MYVDYTQINWACFYSKSKYYYNNDDKNHNKNKTDITDFFFKLTFSLIFFFLLKIFNQMNSVQNITSNSVPVMALPIITNYGNITIDYNIKN
jgi:hypothetical protein